VLGAIGIIGPEASENDRVSSDTRSTRWAHRDQFRQGTPLACLEVLGRSTVDRVVAGWRHIAIDAITLLADGYFASVRGEIDQGVREVSPTWVEHAWGCVPEILKNYRERGIDTAVVVRVAEYIEMDLLVALQFHKEQQHSVTRVFDDIGPLDTWIVDTSLDQAGERIRKALFLEASRHAVAGYVNRLADPRDLRRLAVDGLNAHCQLRPNGLEIRPGVWMSEGAQVDRRARIVGPAFIGHKSRIEEQCLITRCSNIESNCQIDYGTVVEDSTVLSNTYVGIGLDVSRSIVNSTSLLNLERDVVVEVNDPGIIRQNRIPHEEPPRQSPYGTAWGRALLAKDVNIPLDESEEF